MESVRCLKLRRGFRFGLTDCVNGVFFDCWFCFVHGVRELNYRTLKRR